MAEIVIVGGGVAGISAGIEALLSGHNVTVVEKNKKPTGSLVSWNRSGHHIDNCVHWLTGTNPKTRLFKTWQRLGVLDKNDTYQPEVLYTVTYDGKSLSLFSSHEKTREAMLRYSLGDDKEIDSLFKAVSAMNVISETENLSLRSILSLPILLKYVKLSVKELSERFNAPILREFIACFFGPHFGAIALINIISSFTSGNGALPRGGSSEMAKRLVERYMSLGGQLLLGREAVSTESEMGRVGAVILSDGERLPCDYVLFASDPRVTEKILTRPLPKKLTERYSTLRQVSSYHIAFSLTGSVPFRSDLIVRVPTKLRSRLHTDKIMLREFSHEPSFSPHGKNLIEAMIFTEESISDGFIKLRKKSEKEYKRLKERLAGTILKLIENEIPDLKGRLTVIDTWTPATYERYLGAGHGAYMSFVLPKCFLPWRISSKIPGIKNAFLATQWQSLPGGLPTAAECGIKAVREIPQEITIRRKEKGTAPAQ